MSAKKLVVPLADLGRIRLRCKKCETTLELEVKLLLPLKNVTCPNPRCGELLQNVGVGDNHLIQLAVAFDALDQKKDKAEVEFMIEQPS